MTSQQGAALSGGPGDHDARAWVARRQRLLAQVEDALRRARADGDREVDRSFIAGTLERVRSELRRDVSTSDVDAATESNLTVPSRPARLRA